MNSNGKLALSLLMLVAGMLMLTYASVPIYSLFCKLTGFAGTAKINTQPTHVIGTKTIKVRFDANVDKDLPWIFKPKQYEVAVKTGENTLVFYMAKNLSNKPITGMAIYNVTPHKAGAYFNKIQCFCFEQQLLLPGQEILMPVSFYIDPEIEKDPYLEDVTAITLSYTFFKQ
ncbi:Cytochrome C oxidase assembly protein CtaG [Rickettsiales bacterium Ac37b]|nr:Cytochrome C oxidase assembly protein CtaG [Rickettsiales bacterium Ac37b]